MANTDMFDVDDFRKVMEHIAYTQRFRDDFDSHERQGIHYLISALKAMRVI